MEIPEMFPVGTPQRQFVVELDTHAVNTRARLQRAILRITHIMEAVKVLLDQNARMRALLWKAAQEGLPTKDFDGEPSQLRADILKMLAEPPPETGE
jgi:hypothetical protein